MWAIIIMYFIFILKLLYSLIYTKSSPVKENLGKKMKNIMSLSLEKKDKKYPKVLWYGKLVQRFILFIFFSFPFIPKAFSLFCDYLKKEDWPKARSLLGATASSHLWTGRFKCLAPLLLHRHYGLPTLALPVVDGNIHSLETAIHINFSLDLIILISFSLT